MVGRRAGDAAKDVAASEAPEPLAYALPCQAIPVRVHPQFGRRVGDDRRRPLDRVDLRHDGRVDEACMVVEVVVAPVPVLVVAKRIADRVVLAHERRMEDGEA